MDFLLNGQANGDVATRLMQNGFDVGALRPWRHTNGHSYVTLVKRFPDGSPIMHNSQTLEAIEKRKGLKFNEAQRFQMLSTPQTQHVLSNTQATLTRDDWILIDRSVMQEARPRLKAFGDLRAGGRTFTIPNGMGKTVLEYQRMTDIGPATVSMDGVRKGDSERPTFDIAGLPLPIIHKDFQFPLRQIMTSRNGSMPLDTTNAGLSGRKVAEEAENMTLGLSQQFLSYGGYDIHGYTDFPNRITYTIADPSLNGWTPDDTVNDILAMKQLSVNAYHYGPWKCYCSTGWDEYMDRDYSVNKGNNTLRQRIAAIQNVSEPETLDYLTGTQLLLVQETADVARAVVGMDITTVHWPTEGGMLHNYKVMAILVPHLRADVNGNTGIVHGNI